MTAETAAPSERRCGLAARAGRVELCTEDCPLWEHGECSLEALLDPGADAEPEPEDAA
ncbi:MAG TPA: hypothetical protein VF236_09830 [Gaiellaceae bacterium]